MILPTNFTPALSHFLDSWNSTYRWWHPYTREGAKWQKNYSINGTFKRLDQFPYILRDNRWNEYQHYISVYAYKETIKDSRYIGGCSPNFDKPIINKIYGDLDPKPNEDKPAFYHLEKLRKLQKDIPTSIIFTGRGFQFYIRLNQETNLKTIQKIRDWITDKYDLELDANGSPIQNSRVFRLPYTKNIKNNRWTFPVLDWMNKEEIDRISKLEKFNYCFYTPKQLISLDWILKKVES